MGVAVPYPVERAANRAMTFELLPLALPLDAQAARGIGCGVNRPLSAEPRVAGPGAA